MYRGRAKRRATSIHPRVPEGSWGGGMQAPMAAPCRRGCSPLYSHTPSHSTAPKLGKDPDWGLRQVPPQAQGTLP